MIKIYLIAIFALTGCSNMTFNATMCNEIASDPHATMPEECRNYSEEEAEKAFNKTQEKQESKENIIKFSKDQDDTEN
ncbi:MAG: hypothetical protein U9Q40_03920 [Campylobacterota bacterium]|nr:hypothetical protein [Campylobacterota bacterium]